MKYDLEQGADYILAVDVWVENGENYINSADSYDPLVELEITDNFIWINNGFHHHGIALEEHRDDGYVDRVKKVVTYKRKRIWHGDIDVVEYEDYDHVTIWSL